MPGPLVLDSLVPGEVVEVRVYATAFGQEDINRMFFRINADTGVPDNTTADVLAAFILDWRIPVIPLLPPDYKVRQYWAGIIDKVNIVAGPPVKYVPVYSNQTVVLGNSSDEGTLMAADSLPMYNTFSVQRYGTIRNKYWRSGMHLSPVDEAQQKNGTVDSTTYAAILTTFTANFTGPLLGAALADTNAVYSLFSYALAGQLALTQAHMEDATQNIVNWVPNRNLGSQLSRKPRNAGY